MNKPGRLPPFKNGLRVVPYYDPRGVAWRVDVNGKERGEWVNILPGESWADAIADLNARIETPITLKQLGPLVEAWA